MSKTFKLVSAALGFVIAAASIGTASAQTAVRTPLSVSQAAMPSQTKAGTVKIASKHRVHVTHRTAKHAKIARHTLKHVKLAHHSSKRIKVSHTFGLKHVAKARLVTPQKHAMNHRTGVKASVIR